MFHSITLIILAYLVIRFIIPQRWSVITKVIVTIAFLPIAQIHNIYRNFFGSMASPELPFLMVCLISWLFGAFVLLFALVVIKDIINLVLWVLSKVDLPLKIQCTRWAGLFIVLSLAFSGLGVWQSVRVPDVKTVEITLKNLPPELDGLSIVQISDLHASRLLQGSWVQAVVTKANAQNPDLILLTGDMIDGAYQKRSADIAPISQLSARLGVFAIPGNHEYYSNYTGWVDVFPKLGLSMLHNEHVVIEDKGQAFVLAGTTDRVASRFSFPPPDIEAALQGMPQNIPVILMEHQPRDAAKNAKAGVDLQLSGHTHGGQILGLNLISKYVNKGFVSGLYDVEQMQLYVSNGAGLWPGFAIRLGCPSEITKVILRSPNATQVNANN